MVTKAIDISRATAASAPEVITTAATPLMPLVGKAVVVRGWGPQRGRRGKCVEWVPGEHLPNGSYRDGYYLVEIDDGCFKFYMGEIRRPSLIGGFLRWVVSPWLG